jgi:ESX secretion system ATPase EccB
MASRRDQLQSYRFLVHRVISALVMRETDPAESPLRRGVGAMFAGLMVSVIVAAGFGVYGLLTHIGDSKWQFDGAVVVEKETGAVYLYQGGVLHPMANYASALLASGHTPPTTASVSRNSLIHIARGGALGIPNAPDALPDAGKRVGAPWTVCTAPGGNDNPGDTGPATVLLASLAPQGARKLPDDRGLLVQVARRQTYYLVYHGYRYVVRKPTTVLPSLYGDNPQVVSVGPAWVNVLSEGAPIEPITVPKSGTPSTLVPQRNVGDLLVATLPTGAAQYFLIFEDGLAPISELQRDVYVGQTGAQPITVPLRDATGTRKSTHLVPANGDLQPPDSPPKLAPLTSATDAVCTETGADGRTGVWLGGSLSGLPAGTPTASSTASGTPLADRVVVPSGHVAVLRVLASPSATFGSYSLVTDLGIRYPVVSDAALAMLGYQRSDSVDLPANLADLIPTGPTLDPAAAVKAYDMTARAAR